MATSNERIRSDLILHQLELLAYGRGFAAALIRLLNKVEPELRATLRARLERSIRFGGDIGPRVTARLAEIERAYREALRPTWAEIAAVAEGQLSDLAAIEVVKVAAIVDARLPVIVDLALPTMAELREIVRHAPIDGALLRGWVEQLERRDRDRIMSEIRAGMLAQETPIQISRRLFGLRDVEGADGVKAVTKRGVAAMAQTATAAIAAQTRQAVYDRNRDVITREQYVATLDQRTTMECASLDGNIYEAGKGPQPPIHINCRSLRVPYFDSLALANRPANAATERELGNLRGDARRAKVRELVGQVPASTTYQEWLGGLPARVQDEILGPTRGRLFRRGGITLDRFVDTGGRKFTIAELRDRLPPGAFERAGL